MTKILIVEDDPDISMQLLDDLRLEGYSAEAVDSGEAALQRCQEGGIDLLLLDVMLPGIDGFEVCRQLRRSNSPVLIIVLTAKTQEAEKVMGLELGADDYVTKPFSPRELRARIKAVLRRFESPNQVVRAGWLELDFKRFELRVGGREVELTPTEFRLLSAFVRNPGQVLSREQLLDQAWGHGTYVTDRVVDTHVGNLRKKIEPDPKRPVHIVSILGYGYRFEADPKDVKDS